MKQICPLHHFFFNGNNCPFCEQERIERLSQKFDNKMSQIKKEKTHEITEDDLEKVNYPHLKEGVSSFSDTACIKVSLNVEDASPEA